MSVSLPTIGLSRKIWPATVNAFMADLAARTQALGGGTMTAPLPIVNDSQNAWGSILNTYLIELQGRVSVVETTPLPPPSNVLPSGTTWAQVLAAVAAAAPGDTIALPNETIVQTTSLEITKPLILAGSGPLSCLEHQGTMSVLGTGAAIAIHHTHDVELRNFKIKCNRALAPAATRMDAIIAGYGLYNLDVHHITFEDITSNCFLLVRTVLAGEDIHHIYFHDNIGDEFYEQFFEMDSPAADIFCYLNTCTSTSGHPQLGSTEPFGYFIGMERPPAGVVERVFMAYNTCDLSGLSAGEAVNAACITLSDGGAINEWRYDKIAIVGNTCMGGNSGIRLQTLRSYGTDPVSIEVFNNTITGTLSNPIRLESFNNTLEDYVVFTDNKWTLPGGITEGWNTSGVGALQITNIRNTAIVAPATVITNFNASDSDHVFRIPATPAVDGDNVERWTAESARDIFLNYQQTSAQGPTYKTVTPLMALPCLKFNGSTEYLIAFDSGFTVIESLGAVLSPSAKTILMAIYIEGVTLNTDVWLNHGILTDGQGFFGIHLRTSGGIHHLQAYNDDGSVDVLEATVSLNTRYVVMVRHDGVNLYMSLNGGAESSMATGPTLPLSMNSRIHVGVNGYDRTAFFNGRIGEIKLWNENLTGSTLSTAISAFTTKWA